MGGNFYPSGSPSPTLSPFHPASSHSSLGTSATPSDSDYSDSLAPCRDRSSLQGPDTPLDRRAGENRHNNQYESRTPRSVVTPPRRSGGVSSKMGVVRRHPCRPVVSRLGVKWFETLHLSSLLIARFTRFQTPTIPGGRSGVGRPGPPTRPIPPGLSPRLPGETRAIRPGRAELRAHGPKCTPTTVTGLPDRTSSGVSPVSSRTSRQAAASVDSSVSTSLETPAHRPGYIEASSGRRIDSPPDEENRSLVIIVSHYRWVARTGRRPTGKQ
jgi:hypothetical protein